MRKNKFIDLFDKCDEKLKELAFTHSSYANQNNVESNERIEFLGDSVLSLVVTDYLYKHVNKSEGNLTKLRSRFVCTENLSRVAKKLNIESKIKFGKSFQDNVSDAILEDTIECMIGVLYLSYGLHSVSSAIIELLGVKEALKEGLKPLDYKSLMQEYCQSKKCKLQYKINEYTTKGGQTNFRANMLINEEFIAYGQGSTKREAEQNAAKKSYNKILK